MSDSLRSTLEAVSRDVEIPGDLADAALRLAGRRRRRAQVAVPLVAMLAVAVLVLVVAAVLRSDRQAVVPAGPATGPGSVPSVVGRSSDVRSEFSAPIARASLMYRDRGGTPMLVSADSDAVRALRVSSSGGYRGSAYALSPDGAKVAYGWQKASPVGGAQSKTQLRVVTLATGETASLALPGIGLGEPVESITWSADGARLLVQGVVTEGAQQGGGYGTVECFLVDIDSAGALTRGAKVQFTGPDVDGWSTDGQRLLSVQEPTADITNLAGKTVSSTSLRPMSSDVGRYGNSFGAGGQLWSPDERHMAIAVALASSGRPLTDYDGRPRPYVLRTASLASSDSGGLAPEDDFDLGGALDAQVIGWADNDHPLVGVLFGGVENVYAVDIRSGGKRVVVRFDAGVTSAAPQLAGDIVSEGGFR